jgi:hypothetical protein
MNEVKVQHIAVASNSEKESDEFFVQLLGLKKSRSFSVSADLSRQFFNINRDIKVIRYVNDNLDIEVIITDDNSKSKDNLTHMCLEVGDREEFLKKVIQMGFETIKIPRKNSDGYYLFIKDKYLNSYEIK